MKYPAFNSDYALRGGGSGGHRAVVGVLCGLVGGALLMIAGLVQGCGGGATPVAQDADEGSKFLEVLERAEGKQRAHAQETALYDAIFKFQKATGRMPSNLTEIVQFNILDAIPPPPEGTEYMYSPEKGRFVLVRAGTQRAAAAAQQQQNMRQREQDASRLIP